jgi:hypothetical protein
MHAAVVRLWRYVQRQRQHLRGGGDAGKVCCNSNMQLHAAARLGRGHGGGQV